MSPKILVSCPSAEVANIARDMAPKGFETVVVHNDAEVIPNLSGIEYMICYPHIPMRDEFYKAVPKLRLVQLLSAGYDSMNLKLLGEFNIPCANNGGANSRAVADHAVLGMLALYRNLSAADKAMRQGKWSAAIDGTNTFEMAGKLVGIMGIGNIGQKVARRVQAFESRVQYYDPYLSAENRDPTKCCRFARRRRRHRGRLENRKGGFAKAAWPRPACAAVRRMADLRPGAASSSGSLDSRVGRRFDRGPFACRPRRRRGKP